MQFTCICSKCSIYSASEENLETLNCFFVLHDMRDLTKKKHCPKTDLIESMHPAQSASENPKIWRLESLGKNNPWLGQLLRYLRTLKVAAWWAWVGLVRNWLHCWVMKVMSSVVMFKYNNHPTYLLYVAITSKGGTVILMKLGRRIGRCRDMLRVQ